ncbi:MAG: CvpA family protein [Chloroflexi bacterium]|nr:CvpA family protein [Chloroflexota bacterium]
MNVLLRPTDVDLALLGVLALFTLQGARQGLRRGLFDLVTLALGLLVAFRLQAPAAAVAAPLAGLDSSVVRVIAFLALFILAQTLIGALFGMLATALSGPLGLLLPVRAFDRFGGAVLGAGRGVILLGLTLGLVLEAVPSLPLDPGTKRSLQESRVGEELVGVSSRAVPLLERVFGSVFGPFTDQRPRLFLETGPGPANNRQRLDLPTSVSVQLDPSAETHLLTLLNLERAAAGLPPLVMDDRLRAIAQSHSEEMVRLAYFAHESPLTGALVDRLRRASIRYAAAGENLAYAPTVDAAHRGLMDSPEHRQNILSPAFRRIGIGAVNAVPGGRLFTQIFTD